MNIEILIIPATNKRASAKAGEPAREKLARASLGYNFNFLN